MQLNNIPKAVWYDFFSYLIMMINSVGFLIMLTGIYNKHTKGMCKIKLGFIMQFVQVLPLIN